MSMPGMIMRRQTEPDEHEDPEHAEEHVDEHAG